MGSPGQRQAPISRRDLRTEAAPHQAECLAQGHQDIPLGGLPSTAVAQPAGPAWPRSSSITEERARTASLGSSGLALAGVGVMLARTRWASTGLRRSSRPPCTSHTG